MGNSCGCVGVSHAMAHFSLSTVFPQTCARATLRSFDCDPLPFAMVPPSDAVTGAGAACAGG